jgi:hypothetical protein
MRVGVSDQPVSAEEGTMNLRKIPLLTGILLGATLFRPVGDGL